MDYGHKQAEKNLIKLERRIAKEYRTASREMQAKADKYFAQFEAADKKKKADLQAGKITEWEYKRWRSNKMLSGKRYQGMVSSLSKQMNKSNQRIIELIADSTGHTFSENFNYAGYEVSKLTNAILPFTLVDEHTVNKLIRENTVHLPRPKLNIPKDLRWNRQKMNSALTQGVLQGESISKIAKRLQTVADMNQHAAIRNARTLTTGAENGGRLERYKEAKDMGIPIMKKWEATLDNVTRDSHVDVDGEVQEIDHPFSNGLDYPGGMGPPEEVYNCRCTMVSEIKGHKYDNSERYKALGDMSYKQWKAERGSHGK